MDAQNEAFFQAGEVVGKTHYKFATDLLWATLLHNIPEKQHQEKAEALLRRTSSLSQADKAIDDVVICYM